MARRVLVTGGAGFIGSHVADAYRSAGDEVWVVDDLSSGKQRNVPAGARLVRMDIRDPAIPIIFNDRRSRSNSIRSPSSTTAIMPLRAASGVTWPMTGPRDAPEKRPSVIRETEAQSSGSEAMASVT